MILLTLAESRTLTAESISRQDDGPQWVLKCDRGEQMDKVSAVIYLTGRKQMTKVEEPKQIYYKISLFKAPQYFALYYNDS